MKIHKLVILGLISLFLVSCASSPSSTKTAKPKKIKMTESEYLSCLDEGNYERCISYLLGKNQQKNTKDAIRDYFDIAMLYHYLGNYPESLKILNNTDVLMHEAVTKSITKGISSAVFNENNSDYSGTPYEYVYINLFNALNYYALGDIEGAGVEVRKLNNKQREYLTKYGSALKEEFNNDEITSDDNDSLSKAYDTFKIDRNDIKNNRPRRPTDNDIFKDSPTCRYLSMLFYLMDKDYSNANLDAKILNSLNPSFNTKNRNIPEGKGRLDVLSLVDLIGRRGEQRTRIGPFIGIQLFISNDTAISVPPFDLEFVNPVFPQPPLDPEDIINVPSLGIYLPQVDLKYGRRSFTPQPVSTITRVEVAIESGQKFDLELLEDFNYAVNQDVNIKARHAFNRSVGRSLTKKMTTLTAGSAGLSATLSSYMNNENPLSLIVYYSTYKAVAKSIDLVDASETADIRQVYALPERTYAQGINLDPGTYEAVVRYYDKNNNVIGRELFQEIIIKEGEHTLVETTCLE